MFRLKDESIHVACEIKAENKEFRIFKNTFTRFCQKEMPRATVVTGRPEELQACFFPRALYYLKQRH